MQTAEAVHATTDVVGPDTISTSSDDSTSIDDALGKWEVVTRKRKHTRRKVTWAVPLVTSPFTKTKNASRKKNASRERNLIKFNTQQSHRVTG